MLTIILQNQFELIFSYLIDYKVITDYDLNSESYILTLIL